MTSTLPHIQKLNLLEAGGQQYKGQQDLSLLPCLFYAKSMMLHRQLGVNDVNTTAHDAAGQGHVDCLRLLHKVGVPLGGFYILDRQKCHLI